jgi:hypothetical protein
MFHRVSTFNFAKRRLARNTYTTCHWPLREKKKEGGPQFLCSFTARTTTAFHVPAFQGLELGGYSGSTVCLERS